MTLRRLIIVGVLAAAACGDDAPPAGRFRAVGTLIHEGLADGDSGAWATELEVLRSRRLLERVGEDLHLTDPAQLEDVRRGLRVARRRDSRLIEVSVALDDGQLARTACNALLHAYVEHGMSGAANDSGAAYKAVATELEEVNRQLRIPNDAGVEARALEARHQLLAGRLAEIQLTRVDRRADVQILDSCGLKDRRPRR